MIKSQENTTESALISHETRGGKTNLVCQALHPNLLHPHQRPRHTLYLRKKVKSALLIMAASQVCVISPMLLSNEKQRGPCAPEAALTGWAWSSPCAQKGFISPQHQLSAPSVTLGECISWTGAHRFEPWFGCTSCFLLLLGSNDLLLQAFSFNPRRCGKWALGRILLFLICYLIQKGNSLRGLAAGIGHIAPSAAPAKQV